jgi:hypothetical protein
MSLFNKMRMGASIFIKVGAVLTLWSAGQAAHALPSYARQTGMDCVACHVGGFGPQLTPAGIRFKLGGYTDSDGQEGKVPLSGMVVGSWTHTKADQVPVGNVKANNNLKMDEASIFLAGRLLPNVGSFVQMTYDGVEKKVALDHVDVRYARALEINGKDSILGVSVNNNPGVQDAFNTMPVWGYPFIGSPVAGGTGDSASLINGGLEHRVAGASGYVFYDNTWYGELGTYRSLSSSFQTKLGQGPVDDTLNKLGANTYWRMGWFKDLKSQALHLGMFGWNAEVLNDRTSPADPRNKYRDLGVDGSYQFLGTREHMATLNGSYIRERKTDGVTSDISRINERRLNASYHFQQTWGGSFGVFSNSALDAAGLDAGTRGHLVQVDWTPWGQENRVAPAPFSAANLRLGAQYWMYSKFNGDTVAAKDHNTVYLFAWTSF